MFLKYNYPGIIWGLIMLLLLGLPGNDFPKTPFLNIPGLDKIVHGGLFFVFVFLLARGFILQNHFSLLHHSFLRMSLLTGVMFGAITELLQGTVFINRTADILDFAADVAGCIAGIAFFLMMRRKIIPDVRD